MGLLHQIYVFLMFTIIFDVPCLTKIVTFEYKTHKLERVTHQAASIYP
jgi:hypothetical protein